MEVSPRMKVESFNYFTKSRERIPCVFSTLWIYTKIFFTSSNELKILYQYIIHEKDLKFSKLIKKLIINNKIYIVLNKYSIFSYLWGKKEKFIDNS